IVFFEWRLGELAAELAAAQQRASNSEAERARAEEQTRIAQLQAQAARLSLAELEAERARVAAPVGRPAPAPPAARAGPAPAAGARRGEGSGPGLEAEGARWAHLRSELDEARREIARQRSERERWLSEMIEQARTGEEAPAALAEFISELRGEVLALREREKA